MPKKEKKRKTGSTGRFGARYGTKIRQRVKSIEEEMKDYHKCLECGAGKVKRVGTGIWKCERCGTKFAAKAYKPNVTPIEKEVAAESAEGTEE